MSTPSSMVGEQYRTGSLASLKDFSRSWRTAASTWAVCSRASKPISALAVSAYNSLKNGLMRPCF